MLDGMTFGRTAARNSDYRFIQLISIPLQATSTGKANNCP